MNWDNMKQYFFFFTGTNYCRLFFIAVVEELFKRRQPLPSMDAIYFIQPSKEKYISLSFFLLNLICFEYIFIHCF